MTALLDADDVPIRPNEQGTMAVTIGSFTDAAGTVVTPTAIEWRLMDSAGAVVNSRSAVSVTPASSVVILLRGDDLALSGAYVDGWRFLLVTYTYDSSLGTGLVDRIERRFEIEPLLGVS